MKLFCDPISTTSRPVMLFAAEAGIALDREHVDLMSHANREAAYLAVNPNGVVPFLVDGDFALGESSAILKYLADKVGSKTYPKALKARAKVNEQMDWLNTQIRRDFCIFTVYPRVLTDGHLPPQLNDLRPYGEAASARWLGILDAELKDRAFLCGEELTIADYLGAAYISLGDLIGYDFSPFPNVERWLATMKARPAWPMANAGFNGWLSAIRAQAA